VQTVTVTGGPAAPPAYPLSSLPLGTVAVLVAVPPAGTAPLVGCVVMGQGGSYRVWKSGALLRDSVLLTDAGGYHYRHLLPDEEVVIIY
jgi:hypothetical protein